MNTEAFWTLENIVSIGALIFTPIVSWMLINYQLKKNQLYWIEQQKILKNIELSKIKTSIYREIVELVNEINDVILNHYIYMSNRDISMILRNFLKKDFPEEALFYSEQYSRGIEKVDESYNKMRKLSAKFSSFGVYIKMYFDENIVKLFLELHNKIQASQKPIMTPEESTTYFVSLLKNNKNWVQAKDVFIEKYDFLGEKQRPISETNIFLTELLDYFDDLRLKTK